MAGFPSRATLPYAGSEWAAEARRIGEYLQGCVRRATDGSLVWLKPPRPDREAAGPLSLGPHLYAGCVGVALFLAALGYVQDDAPMRDLAARTLGPLRRRLVATIAAERSGQESGLRLGGLLGIGGLVYSFVRIAGWLDDTALIAEAAELATLIHPDRIAADENLEVMYGSAGAIFGLLALDAAVPGAMVDGLSPLARAVLCGEHLLCSRTVFATAAGERACSWPARGGAPLSGFAHGASGVAAALARLAERTGRADFLAAALEGAVFESTCYAPERRNWRASASPDSSMMTAWCNGAPGIALARLRLAAAVGGGDRRIGDELEVALATTHEAPPTGYDFVCCGAMGCSEILLEAGLALDRPDLVAKAEQLAAGVVARAALREHPPSHPHYNPGFFRGAAGIGYALLRLDHPADLPCVLALD